MNNRFHRYLSTALVLALLLLGQQVLAQDNSGEETLCTSCHNSTVNPGLQAIKQTAHGMALGSGNNSCIQCHGESENHKAQPNEYPAEISFGKDSHSSAQLRNNRCLSCHEGEQRIMWHGSTHDDEEVACNNCHQAHSSRDPILDSRQQVSLCVDCHTAMKAQLKLPSRHPIEEGKTTCSDCHNPHGSTTEASLVGTSPISSCLQCHSEKRGPFLFEHPPASEDCGLCHKPHGSVNADLLTTRGPFLCQQCHSAAFHPSQLNDGSGLPSGSANQNMLGKNCLNCHAQVHGTNHPSGGRLAR